MKFPHKTKLLFICFLPRDVLCGALHCESTSGSFNSSRFWQDRGLTVLNHVNRGRCYSSVFNVARHDQNPTFVWDGTKCGKNKVNNYITNDIRASVSGTLHKNFNNNFVSQFVC